ncbi:MAG: cytochrome b/b6 domain-containing protein [Candidatus Thiodiazotropha sp. (ex Monitilora ramsayi)]|nr:cytochrome b/b6 domain-containing protein [Candidatus Thiodiazotropha sp. (ex Monitilora ramsayi)]
MQVQTVTRVLVWSRWLRLSHWSLGIATLGLLMTGWLIGLDTGYSTIITDLHYLLSGVFLPALLLRLYLLFFGSGTDLLEDCEPNLHRLSQAWEVIRFYLTLGKLPLPKWYSHNPLWGPIYLALFFFLILSAASGLFILNNMFFAVGISMLDLHLLSFYFILTFTVLHMIAVFAHDTSNRAGDISAMINGFRQFEISELTTNQNPGEQTIPLENLIKTLKQ